MIRVLCVCLGNICRSPAAEAILQAKLSDAGIDALVDSAGTGDWHVGEMADQRMRDHAARRGFILESRGRQIKREDLQRFDYVLTMDQSNQSNVQRLAGNDVEKVKIQPICEFIVGQKVKEVPDPYYGGASGFEKVLDILESAADGFVEHIKVKNLT